MPTPYKTMFSGPPVPVCEMASVPLACSLIVGTKETETWHAEAAGRGLPQVLVSEKSPVVVTEVIVTGAEETLARVTRRGIGAAPAYCVPNVTDVVETAIESWVPVPPSDTTSIVELGSWIIVKVPGKEPAATGANVTLILQDNAGASAAGQLVL